MSFFFCHLRVVISTKTATVHKKYGNFMTYTKKKKNAYKYAKIYVCTDNCFFFFFELLSLLSSFFLIFLLLPPFSLSVSHYFLKKKQLTKRLIEGVYVYGAKHMLNVSFFLKLSIYNSMIFFPVKNFSLVVIFLLRKKNLRKY